VRRDGAWWSSELSFSVGVRIIGGAGITLSIERFVVGGVWFF